MLEIGPGAGRWSGALAGRAGRLTVIDISEQALKRCRASLAAFANVSYVLGDGRSLRGVGDGEIDVVWSFDVFVHVAPTDLDAYLAEIARVLRRGGVAAIHHSDGRNRGRLLSRHGWRAPMSRELFANLAQAHGLTTMRRVEAWGEGERHDLSAFADVISVCRNGESG